MGGIKYINLARLKTKEDFGFQKLILMETDKFLESLEQSSEDGPQVQSLGSSLPKILQRAISSFRTGVEEFDVALSTPKTNPAVPLTTAADIERGKAWRGANNYLTSMTVHPQAEIAKIAKEAKWYFEKHGDPTKRSQTEESSIILNLLQDIEAMSAEKRQKIYFDPWYQNLKDKEDAYLAAMEIRIEEGTKMNTGIIQNKRKNADDKYSELVHAIDIALQIDEETDYSNYIKSLNIVIDNGVKTIKKRTTQKKNEQSEEEDRPTVQ